MNVDLRLCRSSGVHVGQGYGGLRRLGLRCMPRGTYSDCGYDLGDTEPRACEPCATSCCSRCLCLQPGSRSPSALSTPARNTKQDPKAGTPCAASQKPEPSWTAPTATSPGPHPAHPGCRTTHRFATHPHWPVTTARIAPHPHRGDHGKRDAGMPVLRQAGNSTASSAVGAQAL
jgi:hypothetical protein